MKHENFKTKYGKRTRSPLSIAFLQPGSSTVQEEKLDTFELVLTLLSLRCHGTTRYLVLRSVGLITRKQRRNRERNEEHSV